MYEKFGQALDWFRMRKRVYAQTFTTIAGQEVFRDLSLFCRANETCVVLDKEGRVDTHLSAILEGRREVYLRIQQHMGLTPQQLMTLYSGGSIKAGE